VTQATPDQPEQMDPKALQARLDRLVPPENEARWAKRVLRELMDHPAPQARSQGLLALRAMLAQRVHKDYRVLLAQPELKDPRAIRATQVRPVRLVRPVRRATPVVLVLPASLFRSEPS
jgi:hypothetical protein